MPGSYWHLNSNAVVDITLSDFVIGDRVTLAVQNRVAIFVGNRDCIAGLGIWAEGNPALYFAVVGITLVELPTWPRPLLKLNTNARRYVISQIGAFCTFRNRRTVWFNTVNRRLNLIVFSQFAARNIHLPGSTIGIHSGVIELSIHGYGDGISGRDATAHRTCQRNRLPRLRGIDYVVTGNRINGNTQLCKF